MSLDIYKKYGSDAGRLLSWLQNPKNGISQPIAGKVIQEIATELEEGKEWFRDSLFYSEEWREKMAQKKPSVDKFDTFWLEMYVLERCKWLQEDLLIAIGGQFDQEKISETLNKIAQGVANQIYRADKLHKELYGLYSELSICINFFKGLKAFFSFPKWMKR